MIKLFSYSLSLRLLAIFLTLAALFAWGVIAGIRWAYSADDLRTLISGHLQLHIDYVRQDLGSPPRPERAQAIAQRVPVDIHIAGPGLRWSSDPTFPDPASLNFGPSDYFSAEPGALLDELKGVVFAERGNHRFFKFQEGAYDITVVTPKLAQQQRRPQLVPILVGFALLLVLSAYLAVRGLFRPLATIRAGAAYIGAGHFEHRIKTPRDDELGALANDVNLMAGKVQGMLDAKRELLLGVNHELRSPLSRMTLGLALLDDSAAVRALRADVEEMRQVISTLLDAERMGTSHTTLQLSHIAPATLVQDLIQQSYSNESRIRLQLSDLPPQQLDVPRIQLMLKNLLNNALRYAPPASGPIELSVRQQGDQLVFAVRDHGPGINSTDRAHLFEPFYRPDDSRARETGGTGLGLYLARQIARAHGGELNLEEADGPGALFVARLPLQQRPDVPQVSSRVARLVTWVAMLTAGLGADRAAAAQPQRHDFEVFLDAKRIGSHLFEVTTLGTEQWHVKSEARFDVRFLGVTAFRYQHQANEQWQNGCLDSIQTQTNENGKLSAVSGKSLRGARESASFKLEVPPILLEQDCVVTYAYWDPDRLLKQQALLNPQSGKLDAVRFETMGQETLQVGGKTVAATHYRLRGPELVIDLWYSPSGQWLQLESSTTSKRRLRYRLRN